MVCSSVSKLRTVINLDSGKSVMTSKLSTYLMRLDSFSGIFLIVSTVVIQDVLINLGLSFFHLVIRKKEPKNGWCYKLDNIMESMNMNLSKLWEIVKDREAWHAVVHEVTKSWTWLSKWTRQPWILCRKIKQGNGLGSREGFASLNRIIKEIPTKNRIFE